MFDLGLGPKCELLSRLVARGFQQAQGRDYDETFAPVAHMSIVRTLIAVAATSNWALSVGC